MQSKETYKSLTTSYPFLKDVPYSKWKNATPREWDRYIKMDNGFQTLKLQIEIEKKQKTLVRG